MMRMAWMVRIARCQEMLFQEQRKNNTTMALTHNLFGSLNLREKELLQNHSYQNGYHQERPHSNIFRHQKSQGGYHQE